MEEFIDSAGKLDEKVIVVDDEEGLIKDSEEPTHDEAMPDQGAQKSVQADKAPPLPPPTYEDLMTEKPKLAQPADKTTGVLKSSLVMTTFSLEGMMS